MNKLRNFALAALCGAILATSASAGTLAMDFTAPTTNFTNGQWSLGWEFNLTQAVTVTQLGFYDSNQDDLTERHEVGIYDSAGTLLVSGIVAPGDMLVSWFRMTNVAPTVLAAGNGYRIAATTGSEDYTWDPIGFVTDSRVQFVADSFTFSSSLVFPVNSVGLTGWFGPNFAIGAAVPEPSTYAMLGSAIAALAMLRRRK
jgi:hypothetical protein